MQITMETVEDTLDIDTHEIANKVLALRELWISRSNEFPFYTLGRCAYLDGKTDAYYKDSAWQNDILMGEFGNLYEAITKWLEIQYDTPTFLAHELSIPGFHIFPSSEKFLSIAGKWHMDYPHQTLGLKEEGISAFTVAIQLPTSGGGMDWLDNEGMVSYIPYTEGNIILHSGLDAHRIAGIKKYIPNEYRITLQGHTIRRNGDLEVFW